MRLTTRKTVLGTAALITAIVASAALAQSGMRLVVNGKTVSSEIRIINGRPYVPLSDMARAMNGTAVKSHGNYLIQMDGVDTTTPDADTSTPAVAGGANEVHGMRGHLGSVIFTGKWRFSALSVDHTDAYDSQFLPSTQHFVPNGDNEELVVVHCRVKNGMSTAHTIFMSTVNPHNTALTDDNGQSYAPMAFDKRTGSTEESPSMLPGSQTEFAVLFSVPKGTNLKDLVYSVQIAYEDYPNGGTDVRVSLTP